MKNASVAEQQLQTLEQKLQSNERKMGTNQDKYHESLLFINLKKQESNQVLKASADTNLVLLENLSLPVSIIFKEKIHKIIIQKMF